jgi:hypothetical protein
MAKDIGLTFAASDAGKGLPGRVSGRALDELKFTAPHLHNCFSDPSIELPGDPK